MTDRLVPGLDHTGPSRTTHGRSAATWGCAWRFLLLSTGAGTLRHMPALHARTPAGEGVDAFIRHLAGLRFAAITQRIRRHFLDEFVSHAQQAAGPARITIGELMEPELIDARPSDASRRPDPHPEHLQRPGRRGRCQLDAGAGRPLTTRSPSSSRPAGPAGQPATGGRRPADPGLALTGCCTTWRYAGPPTRTPRPRCAPPRWPRWWPTPTGPCPTWPALNTGARHLDGAARIELADGPCPLRAETVLILTRWLTARAAIIAERSSRAATRVTCGSRSSPGAPGAACRDRSNRA